MPPEPPRITRRALRTLVLYRHWKPKTEPLWTQPSYGPGMCVCDITVQAIVFNVFCCVMLGWAVLCCAVLQDKQTNKLTCSITTVLPLLTSISVFFLKVYFYMSCVALSVIYLVALATVPFSLQYPFPTCIVLFSYAEFNSNVVHQIFLDVLWR